MAVTLCCFASHMAVQATSFVTVVKTISENKAISSVDVSTPALNQKLLPELTKLSRRDQDNADSTPSMTRIYITSPYTTELEIPVTPQPEHKSKSNKSHHTTDTSTPTPTTLVEVTQTMTKTESGAPIRNTGVTNISSTTTTSSSSVDICDVYPYPTCAPPPEDLVDQKSAEEKDKKRPEDHDKNDWTFDHSTDEYGGNESWFESGDES